METPKKGMNGCAMFFAAIGAMTVMVFLCAIALFFVYTPSSSTRSRNVIAAPDLAPILNASPTHRVVYQIQTTGCTSFDTTYKMPDGTSQASTYTCSSTEVAHFQAHGGQFVYLSIQNSGDYNDSAYATFSCIIQVDGVPFKKVSANGSYHIASCDGAIP